MQVRQFSCAILFLYFFYGLAFEAYAEDISFSVRINKSQEGSHVYVKNNSSSSLHLTAIEVEFVSKKFEKSIKHSLPPLKGRDFHFKLPADLPSGSYPLLTRVHYLNAGYAMSAVSANLFHTGDEIVSAGSCSIPDLTVFDTLILPVRNPSDHNLQLLTPKEIAVYSHGNQIGRQSFRLKNNRGELDAMQTVYGVLHGDLNGKAAASLCSAKLRLPNTIKQRSALPLSLYASTTLFSLFATVIFFLKGSQRPNGMTSADRVQTRYCFTLFVVTGLLSIFYGARIVPTHVFQYVPFSIMEAQGWAQEIYMLIEHFLEWFYFAGVNYDHFARYFIQPLIFYVLIANYFVLKFLIKPEPKTDKYWQLMERLLMLLPIVRKEIDTSKEAQLFRRHKSTTALYSLALKSLFVPLLASWTVQNILHLSNSLRGFRFEFSNVCQLLISIVIFIDVAIFCVGYLTELPILKNSIRSVDRTVTGWLVCLICYPPLNSIALTYFDHPLHEHWNGTSGASLMFGQILIVLLWFLYLSATIALGFKASNLTNRGIVSSGPYRFVRHPAYASKVFLWILTGVFLGKMNFFLVITLLLIYGLRAWTEERHLLRDPEYQIYRKTVRYAAIPGVL